MNMNTPSIGLNIPSSIHSKEALISYLELISRWGFTAAELRIDSFPLIIGGEICNLWYKEIENIFKNSSLVFTAHMGYGLDLRSGTDQLLHKKVLNSTIEICQKLNIRKLVIHFEEKSEDRTKEQNFEKKIIQAADRAGKTELTLCIENIETERVEPVINFISRANHPYIKMNFDTGHAYLASFYFGFDFIDSFKSALPYLGHMHLSDNTGIFEETRITNRTIYETLPMGYRFEYGRGDIHLPPFWGKIPFNDIFKYINNYNNYFICEYYSERFIPFGAKIYQRVFNSIKEQNHE